MPVINKPTILFVLFNVMRCLSIVAICLAFSGEVVTMASDLKAVQQSSSSSSAIPSTTATTHIFRRSNEDSGSWTPAPAFSRRALVRREPTSLRSLATATSTSSRRPTLTSHSPSPTRAITASNPPSSSIPTVSAQACAYVASTSIPTQPGGSLFSTLSRIFCCLILIAALVGESSPPITSKAGQFVERWWTYAFPPFGRQFGTGVLGGVQVFVGCTVLSHAVGKFTQISGWFLFIVGILNLLCGLAFGSRLKIIRSPFADSTSPSALRKLRLNSSPHSLHGNDTEVEYSHEGTSGTLLTRGGGTEFLESIPDRARRTESRDEDRWNWYRFENTSNEGEVRRTSSEETGPPPLVTSNSLNLDDSSKRVRFTPPSRPAATFGRTKSKGGSRNGPNGIIISAPMNLRGAGGQGGISNERRETVYGEMEEVKKEASSRAGHRGGGAIGVPPPVYCGVHTLP